MAGPSVQKVQNGSSGLSLGNQMSSNSGTNGGSARGDKKNTGIEVIDKSKDTHHTYKVFYYTDTIFTTVTRRASVVDQWIADLYKDYDLGKLNNIVVGLDIEWRRIRRGYTGTRNKVAVLQLCLDKRCLIFQFAHCDQVPKSLKDFLGNDKFIFVGSGVDADAYKLMVDHNLMVARTEEVGSLAAFKTGESRLHRVGLKKLVREFLQQNLPMRRCLLINWERDVLRDEQIEYACLDAFVSFKLGVDLMSRATQVRTYQNNKNNNRQPEMNLKDSDFPELQKDVE
ncbi:hypothetical protein C5167_031892 [Papaver somniferum]|uniref:3'-5' exonuclease domain-containing protein n=1 Tax=Papaver somniferum TaxID=3469 RepID=A0A4Y7K7A4_PAPSO|nr:Werner Syndrome-like exonuclease [Papaver somniferum]RZC68696.1 hypothetical protein C5167_031892 [Papaver somniferum]